MARCIHAAFGIALAIVAVMSAAVAQEPVPAAPPEGQELAEPPYEAQLLRLSEILGAVHYLRRLCESDEGNLWRDQMQALIEAEQPSPIRRARFVDRFNLGFDSYRSVYRACTPAAVLAIDRFMEDGARIARDISARYGQ